MTYFAAIFGRPRTPASCHGLIGCLLGRCAGRRCSATCFPEQPGRQLDRWTSR